jgi:putative MATE family efflux protein
MSERQKVAEDIDALGNPRQSGRADSKVARMGSGSIPRLTIEFAIPAIAGMLVNGAYNIVDSIFLGQAMGPIGQASMTAANPVMIVFMAISMWVGNGGNALSALRLGEGDRQAAERSLANTVTLSLVLSALVALLAFVPVTIDGLLSLSSATPEVWGNARVFIQIISAGFIFQCIGMGVNNFIRTAGAPNRALATMVVGTVVCIALNYLFVMVLGYGIRGSAMATVIGQLASCSCVLWYFLRTPNVPLKLRASLMPLRAGVVRLILTLGLASFLLQVGACVVNLVLNAMLVKYGAMSPLGPDNALASIGVVSRIAMFTVFPLIGTAIAVQPLLGFNYGAHLYDRVRKTLLCGVVGATIIAVLMWALVHLFPTQIISAFGITDVDLRDFTIFAMKVQLMLLPLVGFQIVCSNYFQATGQPAKSVFLSLTRQILFLVPLYLFLPQWLPVWFPNLNGLDALYFACPIADFLAVFATVIFVIWEMQRIRKLESGEVQARF